MLFIYDKTSQDIIYQSSEMFQYTAPNDGIALNASGDVMLDFILNVNNEDFDNDDNPYGSFKYHMYTNMRDLNDTSYVEKDNDDEDSSLDGFEDQNIPLLLCQTGSNTLW